MTEKISSAIISIEDQYESIGSGFIVNSLGMILTVAHVVKDIDEVLVKLCDGRVVSGSVLLVHKTVDLALIQIDLKEELPFIKLGDSDKCRAGEWVIALGSPSGFSNSISVGVISYVNRIFNSEGHEILDHSISTDQSEQIKFIQTDVFAKRGSSGSPLVDFDGEVIGIICGKKDGMMFAVPINDAKGFYYEENNNKSISTETGY